jgi:hypothetical protein
VYGAQILERLVLPEHLDERREHQVRGARRVRIAEHHLTLVGGVYKVLPALGNRQFLLREELGVVAERDDAAVDTGHAPLRQLGDPLRPVVELRDVRRPVFVEQPFLGGLQVRIGRARPPDVALGVGGFGLHLREHLAGGLLHDGHARARRLFEAHRHALAPGGVGRAAIEVELALRGGYERCAKRQGCEESDHDVRLVR